MKITQRLLLFFLLAAGNTAFAQAPVANFTADVTSGCAPLTVSFTDSSSNAPLARILSSAVVGVEPRIMGIGPVKASQKALAKAGLKLEDMDIIELNEAFAAQCLACTRELGLADNDNRINPNGGAIALGHPLGMSGARILQTAAIEIHEQDKKYALVTMCIGVGQGYATVLEKV